MREEIGGIVLFFLSNSRYNILRKLLKTRKIRTVAYFFSLSLSENFVGEFKWLREEPLELDEKKKLINLRRNKPFTSERLLIFYAFFNSACSKSLA